MSNVTWLFVIFGVEYFLDESICFNLYFFFFSQVATSF